MSGVGRFKKGDRVRLTIPSTQAPRFTNGKATGDTTNLTSDDCLVFVERRIGGCLVEHAGKQYFVHEAMLSIA